MKTAEEIADKIDSAESYEKLVELVKSELQYHACDFAQAVMQPYCSDPIEIKEVEYKYIGWINNVK